MAPHDDHSTTATLRRIAPGLAWMPRILRQLTPAAAWGAAMAMFGTAIGMYHSMVAAHAEVSSIKASVKEFKVAVRDMQADQHNIIERLARIEQAETDVKEELDRQRERWERAEHVVNEEKRPRRRR
jgi:Sec-independent protein translocase protein TatA